MSGQDIPRLTKAEILELRDSTLAWSHTHRQPPNTPLEQAADIIRLANTCLSLLAELEGKRGG